jgi:hypothetical protein
MRINGSVIGSTVTPGLVTGATGFWNLQNVDIANRSRSWPTDIITNGIILFLDANNTNSYPGSGTAWYDLSGYGNTGTLTNGPTFSSANGGSIVFDGSDDYVNIANASNLNGTSQTVNLWFLYTSIPGNGVSVIGKHDSLGSYSGYNVYLYAGSVGCQFKNGSGGDAGTIGTAVTANTWLNITFKFTIGSTMSLYKNGNKISTISLGSLSISSQPIRIGRSVDAYWNALPGRAANLQIYNRELSDDEVLQNFQLMRTRFGV